MACIQFYVAITFYQVIASFLFVFIHLLLHFKFWLATIFKIAFKRLLLLTYLIGYYITFLYLKGFCDSGYITVQLLKHMPWDQINFTPTIGTDVWQTNNRIVI